MTGTTHAAVAIVDDDPGVRDSLRFLLETVGHVVETYDSGTRFLAEAEPARLGCLVLDHDMPQLLGLDLLAELVRRDVSPPTLLIVSTPSDAIRSRAAALGVRRVLEKPLAHDDLLGEISAAMG